MYFFYAKNVYIFKSVEEIEKKLKHNCKILNSNLRHNI